MTRKFEDAEHKAYTLIAQMKPGEVLPYWLGHLGEACETGDRDMKFKASVARAAAWRAYENGVAELTQRRAGKEFVYLATRRAFR